MESVWEELISLNARGGESFDVLRPALHYRATDTHPTDWSGEGQLLEDALARDTLPLPTTDDREGYYGPHHFSYWASGHRDWRLIREAAARLDVPTRDYLDFGCASGRVVRHAALDPETEQVFGCDINRRHTDWIAQYLPSKVVAFQNHSIPTLPLPDASIDLVSAYSVFTHIEVFETAWLMELRRILRPGGIAWVTVQTELTWDAMAPGWPLYDALLNFDDFAAVAVSRGALPAPRTVYRLRGDRSYSSHVFYSRKYLRETWGRILPIAEEHHMLPAFQDVVILQKPR